MPDLCREFDGAVSWKYDVAESESSSRHFAETVAFEFFLQEESGAKADSDGYVSGDEDKFIQEYAPEMLETPIASSQETTPELVRQQKYCSRLKRAFRLVEKKRNVRRRISFE